MNRDEIKNSAPHLHNLKLNKSGHRLPSDYFGTIEDSVETRLKLETFPKKDGYKVPQNYFENIESSIIAKLETTEKANLFTLRKFWIPTAIAAMFVLTFGIDTFQDQNMEVNLADMEKWMENGVIDLNSYELAAVYEAELAEIQLSDFVDDNEIADYLHDDIDELYLFDIPKNIEIEK